MSRSVEFRAIRDFLTSAQQRPSALVIEGEAGIGKTTLWLAAVEQARALGFRVLSARTGQAESVMAYAAVADLAGEQAGRGAGQRFKGCNGFRHGGLSRPIAG